MYIQPAQPEDAAAVTELIQLLAAEDGETSPLKPEYVLHYLSIPSSHILLAVTNDGKAAGLLAYSTRPDLYHAGECNQIDALVVHPDHRNRGMGSLLVKHLIHRLEESGCAEISVSTMPGNSGAIRFYRSHGLLDEAVLLEKHFRSEFQT